MVNKKLLFLTFFFNLGFLFLIGGQTHGAVLDPGSLSGETSNSHVITLSPGWNVVSTPRLLDHHEFSAEETLENFSVLVLNPQSASGWSTMSNLGQSEFTPLFGYFIENKTGVEQTLSFYYLENTEPSQRLFSRDLLPGWNAVGVAEPTYALRQKDYNDKDENNPSKILSSLNGCANTVLDFTAGNSLRSSVGIADQWSSAVFSDLDRLSDFRETKAYGVYVNNSCSYNGWQNTEPIRIYPAVNLEKGDRIYNDKVAGFDFKIKTPYPLHFEKVTLNITGTDLVREDLGGAWLDCNGETKWSVGILMPGDNEITMPWQIDEGLSECRLNVSSAAAFHGSREVNVYLRDFTDPGFTTVKNDGGDLVDDIVPVGDFGYDGFGFFSSLAEVNLSNVDSTDILGVRSGDMNVKLAGFNLDVNQYEDMYWESIRLRNGGTNNSNLLSNIRIMVNGAEVAQGAFEDRYINFLMDNYYLPKNSSVLVEVYGDIGVGSLTDTISLYIRDVNDANFLYNNLGSFIGLSNTDLLDSPSKAKTITFSSGELVIEFDKNATPAKEVRPGQKDVVLATLKMLTTEENATINSISDINGEGFYINGIGLEEGEIANFKMVDVNTGAIYTISEAFNNGQFNLNMTDAINLIKGVTKTFQIRADLSGALDNNPIDDGDLLQVNLRSEAISAIGVESNFVLSITPSSISSAFITIKAPSLTWTTTALASKTVVPGAQDVLIYRATLKAGDATDVKLNSVRFDVLDDVSKVFSDNNISQLTLKLNGNTISVKNNSITEALSGNDSYVEFANFSIYNTIPAGQTYTLDLVSSFASSFINNGTFSLNIESPTDSIVVRDSDNNTFTESVVNVGTLSRQITLASTGTLKVELKTSGVKAKRDTYLLAGSETTAGRYLGELVFTTANEPIKIQKLALGQVGTAGAADILAVRLYDNDGNMVAQEGVSANGHVYFDSLNLVMPADYFTSYFIGVVAKSINAQGDAEGTAEYGKTIKFRMANSNDLTVLGASETLKVTGVNSGQDITMTEAIGEVGYNEFQNSTITSKESIIVGSVLTSIVNDMSDGVLTSGNGRTIGKYIFTFNNGSNRTMANEELKAQMKALVLNIASSSVTVSNVRTYIDGQSATKTSAATQSDTEFTLNLTGLPDSGLVDGTITLVVVGDVGSVGTNAYIQTEIENLATDFIYNGNHGVGLDLLNTRLDYNSVIGATLCN
jgi:hypothetical protein